MTHRLSCPRKRASSNLGALVEAQCPTQGLASTGSSACADDDGRVGGAAGAHAMRRREFIAALGAAAIFGFLAARGARAGARAAHRRAHAWHAADDTEAQSRVAAFLQALQQLGWTGRPQRSDRLSLGQRQRRHDAQIRSRTGRARAGRHPGPWQRGHGAIAAGDPHRADRVRGCRRSGCRRLCREPGAAGRQRHRLYAVSNTASAENGWSCSRRSRRA